MSPHEDMDDTADFAATRYGQVPGEASTELGADPDSIGCGPRGTGPGPLDLMFFVALLGALGALILSLFWGA